MYSLMYLVIGLYGFGRLLRLPYSPNILSRSMLLFILSLFFGSLLPGFVFSGWQWLQQGAFSGTRSVRVIGGLVVSLPVVYFYLRRHGIPVGKAFDLGCLPIPLGLAIGRLGCLAAGCCGGRMTDSWFGMRLPDTQGIWALRYPTQLLSAGADFLIFLLLLTWERIFRDKGQGESSYPFDGFIFLLFLGLYSGKRVLIQFLRGDNTPVWGLFNATQFFFLTVVIMVSILIAIGLKARKSPPRWNTISFFSRSRPGFRDPKSEIRDHRSETGKN
jgi:prolipoprotein diacylglyceryltransferase